jgi:asparagine synthase (glutamine-hydrolysing)
MLWREMECFPRSPHRSSQGTIGHRGPDKSGEWQENNVLVSHYRLSIADLATCQQPMHSSNGRLVITFRIPILNFRES